jgi:hypothetical protein
LQVRSRSAVATEEMTVPRPLRKGKSKVEMPSFGFTPSGSPLGPKARRKAALCVKSKTGAFGYAPQTLPPHGPNQQVPYKYDPYKKTFRISSGQ